MLNIKEDAAYSDEVKKYILTYVDIFCEALDIALSKDNFMLFKFKSILCESNTTLPAFVINIKGLNFALVYVKNTQASAFVTKQLPNYVFYNVLKATPQRNSKPSEIFDKSYDLDDIRSITMHELTHLTDMTRLKDKNYLKDTGRLVDKDINAYYRHPIENNAYVMQLLLIVSDFFEKEFPIYQDKITKQNVVQVVNRFLNKNTPPAIWQAMESLPEKYKHKVAKRLYSYIQYIYNKKINNSL